MNFVGNYRLSKVMRYSEEKQSFGFVDIEDAIAAMDDEHDKREQERFRDMILTVKEDGRMIYHMEIPDDLPQEELDKINESCTMYEGDVLVEEQEGKVEGEDLYMRDESKFLTGEEWIKLTTDVPGELNFVTMMYSKVD